MICPQQCCLNTAGAALQTMQWHVTALFIRAPRQMSLSFTKTRKGMAVDGQRGGRLFQMCCVQSSGWDFKLLNRICFFDWDIGGSQAHRPLFALQNNIYSHAGFSWVRFQHEEGALNLTANETKHSWLSFFFSAARERSFRFHIQVSCVAAS